MNIRTKRYECPCCGYPTLSEPGGFEICRLCNWEDDGLVIELDETSGPNGKYTLREAKRNFLANLNMYDEEKNNTENQSYLKKNNEIKKVLIHLFNEIGNEKSEVVKAELWNRVVENEHALDELLKYYSDKEDKLHIKYREFIDKIYSKNEEEILDGIKGLVLNCEDWEYSQSYCVKLSQSKNINVKAQALMCLGHLGRIHVNVTDYNNEI